MKKVLVTGADGFIGSHLTESLLEKGYDVKAFTYYNSFNTWGWLDTLPKEKLDQIEVFSGDIRDPNGVREAMKGVDQVFHLAALIAIPFSYHSPDSYVDTNIKGTLNVLQAARDLGTEKIMVTSTSEVYGTAQYVPIDEKHPYQGQQQKLGQIVWQRAFTAALIFRLQLFVHLIHLDRDNRQERSSRRSLHSFWQVKKRSNLAL